MKCKTENLKAFHFASQLFHSASLDFVSVNSVLSVLKYPAPPIQYARGLTRP